MCLVSISRHFVTNDRSGVSSETSVTAVEFFYNYVISHYVSAIKLQVCDEDIGFKPTSDTAVNIKQVVHDSWEQSFWYQLFLFCFLLHIIYF